MKTILSIFLLCVVASATPIVELTVNERYGQARNNEPITVGVPLPNGYMTDISNLALTDLAGNKINCEFRKVSEWYNNTSLKWVHLDFQTSIPESGLVKFILQNDPGMHAVNGSLLSTTENSEGIEVNTGKIRFFVKKANYNVIEKAIIGADTVISSHNRGLVMKIGNHEYLSSLDAASNTTIEREGAMSVCIKSEGFMKSATAAPCSLYFVARTYAFNNSPLIKYVLSFELQKSNVDDSIVVKSLFVDIPTNLTNATAKLGAPATDKNTTLSASDSVWVMASNPFTIASGTNTAKVFYTFGGSFSGSGEAMDAVIAHHEKTLGWGSLSNGSRGFAFCLRDFWQQNPKSLGMRGDGLCRVGLYPEMRNGEFEDLTWYSGMARTLEMRFALLQNETTDETKALVQGLQSPLLAVAAPSWYCSETQAFGRLTERDTLKIQPKYRLPVQIVDVRHDIGIATHTELLDQNGASGVRIDSYGFFDWGNQFHYSYGSYALRDIMWEGNYYGLDHLHFIEFIRSGDFKYFDFFESSERGNMDTHIGHFGSAITRSTGACRYCPSYNIVFFDDKNPYISGECNHHKNDGMFERFYLCGDERSRDVAIKTVQWAVRAYPGGYPMAKQIRGPGAYCWMLMQAYHYTKQPSYLDNVGRTVIANISQAGVMRTPYSIEQFGWMGPLFIDGLIQYDIIRPSKLAQDFLKSTASYAYNNKGLRWAQTLGYCYSITENTSYLEQLNDHCRAMFSSSNPYKDFAQELRSTSFGLYYFSNDAITVNMVEASNSNGSFLNRIECSPNPFNPIVNIKLYTQDDVKFSKARIINCSGQIVKTLDLSVGHNNGEKSISLQWDGINLNGKAVPSGLYFLKWETGHKTLLKKIVLSR